MSPRWKIGTPKWFLLNQFPLWCYLLSDLCCTESSNRMQCSASDCHLCSLLALGALNGERPLDRSPLSATATFMPPTGEGESNHIMHGHGDRIGVPTTVRSNWNEHLDRISVLQRIPGQFTSNTGINLNSTDAYVREKAKARLRELIPTARGSSRCDSRNLDFNFSCKFVTENPIHLSTWI